jgi:phosphoglycolate phosphatase
MDFTSANEPDILKTVGLPLEDIFEKLTRCNDIGTKKQFRTFFTERADEIMSASVKIYPNVCPYSSQAVTIEGKKNAIVSTKYRYRIEEILSHHNMRDDVC